MQDAHCIARLPAASIVMLAFLFLFAGLSLPTAGDTKTLVCEPGNCLISGESVGDGGHEAGPDRSEQRASPASLVARSHSAIPENPQLAHCASFPVLPQAPPLA